MKKMIQEKLYTPEALKVSAKMLHINPEFYTLWNFRRKALTVYLESEASFVEKAKCLEDELNLIVAGLRQNSKCYWVWHHRVWTTQQLDALAALALATKTNVQATSTQEANASTSDAPAAKNETTEIPGCNWKRELELCAKLLAVDSRNFHCWNYRRFVATHAKVTLEEEFKFTTEKIEENFSNYSAWHQRSTLLPRLHTTDEHAFISALDQEFDFVRNALYTSPEDQSGWLYHRWLIGHVPPQVKVAVIDRELQSFKELLQLEPDSKWTMLGVVFLLQQKERPERDEDEIKRLLSRLQEVDPTHKHYYMYLLKK